MSRGQKVAGRDEEHTCKSQLHTRSYHSTHPWPWLPWPWPLFLRRRPWLLLMTKKAKEYNAEKSSLSRMWASVSIGWQTRD